LYIDFQGVLIILNKKIKIFFEQKTQNSKKFCNSKFLVKVYKKRGMIN